MASAFEVSAIRPVTAQAVVIVVRIDSASTEGRTHSTGESLPAGPHEHAVATGANRRLRSVACGLIVGQGCAVCGCSGFPRRA